MIGVEIGLVSLFIVHAVLFWARFRIKRVGPLFQQFDYSYLFLSRLQLIMD